MLNPFLTKKVPVNDRYFFIAYMIGKSEVNIIIPKEIMMKSAIATLIIEVNKILTIPSFYQKERR